MNLFNKLKIKLDSSPVIKIGHLETHLKHTSDAAIQTSDGFEKDAAFLQIIPVDLVKMEQRMEVLRQSLQQAPPGTRLSWKYYRKKVNLQQRKYRQEKSALNLALMHWTGCWRAIDLQIQ